ncbi:hypothetical protein B0H13DRAFT_1861086 [Mycena leptocephala]|nr:hypothetical protein B0H13DRAFT_1861086 [Mycena leptocephala]
MYSAPEGPTTLPGGWECRSCTRTIECSHLMRAGPQTAMFGLAPSGPFSDLFVPSLAPSEFPPLPQSSSSIFNLDDFSMVPFDNLSDSTFFGEPGYNFDFDFTSFGTSIPLRLWPGGDRNLKLLSCTSRATTSSSSPSIIPTLRGTGSIPVQDSASTPIAAKDIDLTFSEKEIIHDKQLRTFSSRAAAAPAPKKPRSRGRALSQVRHLSRGWARKRRVWRLCVVLHFECRASRLGGLSVVQDAALGQVYDMQPKIYVCRLPRSHIQRRYTKTDIVPKLSQIIYVGNYADTLKQYISNGRDVGLHAFVSKRSLKANLCYIHTTPTDEFSLSQCSLSNTLPWYPYCILVLSAR